MSLPHRYSSAVFLTMGLLVVSCGTSNRDAEIGTQGSASTAAPTSLGKSPPAPSPSLHVTVAPSEGPVGTSVQITGSGCIDPSGQNHAVSFNIGTSDPSAAHDPNNVREITSDLTGSTVTATYTVTPADARFGGGEFFVQCGASVQSVSFVVSR